jgi:hypothetical protein
VRKLNIQPLQILKSIKDGTTTLQDIKTVATIYPQLYQKLTSEMLDAMASHMAKGEDIPYKTRIGLSLFAAQAMDSTLTQQGISAAQPVPPQAPAQQQPSGKKVSGSKAKIGDKTNKMAMTASQAAEEDRQRE